MPKITYYLGAGSSYNSCPILNNQGEMMIAVANSELVEVDPSGSRYNKYKFSDEEQNNLPDSDRQKVLWHIGYFGIKAIEFGTIDTYARMLYLNNLNSELEFLKMSVSVFFDLWENYYFKKFNKSKGKRFEKIDLRYFSLLSVLLNKKNNGIHLDDSINFITWNYDLQLEATLKTFINRPDLDYKLLHSNYFKFLYDEADIAPNRIFHLNGHRGFISHIDGKTTKTFELNSKNWSKEEYWNNNHSIYDSTSKGRSSFKNFLKYAWEHDLRSNWFKKISKILEDTEVLIVIGYSFPPFNREVDQYLFSKLSSSKIKKIIYNDPHANEQVIENLFDNPLEFKNKIEVEKINLNQFYFPNEYFISPKTYRLPTDLDGSFN